MDNLNKQLIGTRIATLRKFYKKSQRELMEELEFENLSKFEKGTRLPSVEILLKIAKYFNVSIDWLVRGTDCVLDISENEIKILKLYRNLKDEDKIKIEGILEYKAFEQQMDNKQDK